MKHSMSSPLKKVPRETFDKLKLYSDTLNKWRSHINLIGNSTDIWERHIKESASLAQYISSYSLSIIDLGTGAGFPGMVLAILGFKNVHLVDSDKKKIVFLREIARLTKTGVTIHHTRIENLPRNLFDVITSRALAPLTTLLHYSTSHLHAHSFCLFPKGKNYSIELERARQSWQFDYEVYPGSYDNGVILAIRNIERK